MPKNKQLFNELIFYRAAWNRVLL